MTLKSTSSEVRKTWDSITNFLLREETEMLKLAAILMVLSFLTKISGLLFQLIIATKFGANAAYNDFLWASTLPEMITNILMTGAISTVIIPLLIDCNEKKGREEFLKLFNSVFNISIAAFLVATVAVIIFAPQIFPLVLQNIIRPDLADYPTADRLANIVNIMRVMMLPNLILGVSVFYTSGLNVYHRLLAPQLAGLFFNVGRILAVFILLPFMKDNSWALVIGVILGSLLHLLIQVPAIRAVKLDFSFEIDWKNDYLVPLFQVAIPRTFAYAADQVGQTVSRLIASGFGTYVYPALNYANNIALVIPAVFGYPFAAAAYPRLAVLYSRKQFVEMAELIIGVINQIFFLSLPFIVTLVILRLPIVRLVYGILPNTQFDRQLTSQVAWILLFFGLGLVFVTTKYFLYRVFFIANNMILPVVLAVFALLLTVILTETFSNFLSHANGFSLWEIPLRLNNFVTRGDSQAAVAGSALAFSVTSTVECLLLLYFNHRVLVPISFSSLLYKLMGKLIPASIMALLMFLMYKTWDVYSFPIDAPSTFSGSTTVNLILLTGITAFTSAMVYYLTCYLLNVEELKILRRFLNPVFRLGGLHIK